MMKSENKLIFWDRSGGIDTVDMNGNIVEYPRVYTPETHEAYKAQIDAIRRTTSLMFLGTVQLLADAPEVWYAGFFESPKQAVRLTR